MTATTANAAAEDFLPAGNAAGEPERVLSFRDGWKAYIFTQWEFPDRILRAWDNLAREYGDFGIFLEIGWFEQWCYGMGRKNALFVTVIEHAGEVKGIFPCWIAPDGQVRPLADACHYDFLLTQNDRERTLDCFFQVIRHYGGGSALFQNFPASSSTPSLLMKRLRQKFIPAGTYTRPSAAFIDLRGNSPAEYTAALHSKLRNSLRRYRKRAEQEGTLSFEVVRRPSSLDTLLTELFEVEYRSWKGAQGTAIQCSEGMESLYRGIARWAVEKDCLYVFTLRLNNQLIAFEMCIAGGRTIFGMKTGYDQPLASRLSPGTLLLYQVIGYLFETGQFDRFDFLGHCYAWEIQWTSQTNTWTSVEIYPRTPAGGYKYMRKYGWKEPFKRSQRLAAIAKRLEQPEQRWDPSAKRPNRLFAFAKRLQGR